MKKITYEQVEHWVTNYEDWSLSEIIQTFFELANGDYEIEQMKKDILREWEVK